MLQKRNLLVSALLLILSINFAIIFFSAIVPGSVVQTKTAAAAAAAQTKPDINQVSKNTSIITPPPGDQLIFNCTFPDNLKTRPGDSLSFAAGPSIEPITTSFVMVVRSINPGHYLHPLITISYQVDRVSSDCGHIIYSAPTRLTQTDQIEPTISFLYPDGRGQTGRIYANFGYQDGGPDLKAETIYIGDLSQS